MINPIAKHADIVAKDEMMIELLWNSESFSDIDLWVLTPNGIIGFPVSINQNSIAYLDRDDLGRSSDSYTDIDGQTVDIGTNREIIFIKKLIEGEYIVNVHGYTINQSDMDLKQDITINIIRLLPHYEIEYTGTIPIQLEEKQEYTVISFTVETNKPLILSKLTQTGIIGK